MKLGFIGCGKMGSALVEGVIASGAYQAQDIVVSDAVEAAAVALAGKCGVARSKDNASLAAECDTLLLCVKPQDATTALRTLGEAEKPLLVISIVAGASIASLQDAAGSRARIVRVMPNTPALVGKGAAAYSTGENVTPEDIAIVETILGSVGLVFPVKEVLLNAVTGLSGSGPAYVYVLIETMADAGVLMGLPRDLAVQLAAQTVTGGAEMVLRTGLHPGQLKDMVTSPGGTTIAGLEALERGGFRASIQSAVRAATEKAMQLGS